MKIWYVEELGLDGEYHPALYHGDKPAARSMGGNRRSFKCAPIEVPTDDLNEAIAHAKSVRSQEKDHGTDIPPEDSLHGDSH